MEQASHDRPSNMTSNPILRNEPPNVQPDSIANMQRTTAMLAQVVWFDEVASQGHPADG